MLGLTLPAFDAVAGSCEADTASACSDLAALELWGSVAGHAWLLRRVELEPELAGRQVELELAGFRGWRLWVCTVDRDGNRSCPSDTVLVPVPLGVAPADGAVSGAALQLYDVAGRRLDSSPGWRERIPPGVYFVRRAGCTRRVVIVH